MSTEIATLERVRTAVEALHAHGRKATANAVLEEIGGGSKPTILKHLRALRQVADNPVEPIPTNILEKAKPVLAEIYAAGSAAQEARTREQTDRYHRIMSDLEAQIAEFETSSVAQEKQIAELTKHLAERERAVAELSGKLEHREAELTKIRKELADCQRDQADVFSRRLEALGAQMDDLSSKLTPAKTVGEVEAKKDKS